MKYFFISVLLILVFSCELEGVKKTSDIENGVGNQTADTLLTSAAEDLKLKKSFRDSVENILSQKEVEMEKVLENGIKINWFKKGEGKLIEKFDVLKIDYRVKLEDGTVYDGNHLINKKSIAFPVGWNLQTEGWEIAMRELRVGDEVKVFLPSIYARGKKGIPGIVPPNANNVLELRILELMAPTKVVDGTKVYVVEQSKKHTKTLTQNSKLALDYFVSSESKPRFDNSYQRGKSFELTLGDGNIVPGLYKSLIGLKEMDKAYIHIPSNEAYGKKGLKPNVKPNEDLLYDVILSQVY